MKREEQETTVTYNMADQMVHVYSSVLRDQNKLKRAGISTAYGNLKTGFGYRIPLSRFRWGVRVLERRVQSRKVAKTGGISG